MNSDTVHDDISYLRKLAESGRSGPILGGIFLAAAGIIFGAASILDFAAMRGLFPVRGSELWLGASGVFTLIWLVLFFRMRCTGTAASPSQTNATFAAIWMACAPGVLVAFGTTVLIAHQSNNLAILSAYVPVIYAFYGTAWFASAALARRSWMFLAALGSFVFAFVIALFSNSEYESLAMAGGLLLLLTLPGLKLAKDEARP
jgi:hypothetical protein